MFVLVRKVESIYWTTSGLESVSIKSITSDWGSKDENWSVFKVTFDGQNYTKNDQTHYIALRLIASNPQKCESGIDLLVLEENFYNTFFSTQEFSEDSMEYNTVHINLTNIQYKHLNNALNYSIENSEKIISYSSEELQEMLLTMKGDGSLAEFKKFVIENSNDPSRTFGDIRKAFLKDHPKFFKD